MTNYFTVKAICKLDVCMYRPPLLIYLHKNYYHFKSFFSCLVTSPNLEISAELELGIRDNCRDKLTLFYIKSKRRSSVTLPSNTVLKLHFDSEGQ